MAEDKLLEATRRLLDLQTEKKNYNRAGLQKRLRRENELYKSK